MRQLTVRYLWNSGEKLEHKLRKSLYGLKQSGRSWNNVLHEYLLGENLPNHLLIPVFTLVIVLQMRAQL